MSEVAATINGWHRGSQAQPKDGEMCVIIFTCGVADNITVTNLAVWYDGKGFHYKDDELGMETYLEADKVIWWYGLPKVPSKEVVGW